MTDIRDMMALDVLHVLRLVESNWGENAKARCHLQCLEYFKGGAYAPKFFVAYDGNSFQGFGAYVQTMMMPGVFESVWTAVEKVYQGQDVGGTLTRYRINDIRMRGGKQIYHMTEKRKYFERFGFEVAKTFGSWHLMVRELEPLEM